MSKPKIFPIYLRALETSHFTQSAYRYRTVFLEARKAMTDEERRGGWYAYDVIVRSRTMVDFVVYDMRDNFDGGIGKELHQMRGIRVPASLTKPDVDAAIVREAIAMREREIMAAEDAIIAEYAKAIRASLKRVVA